MGSPWYCTRDDVTGALDMAETARNIAQVDRLIEAGARQVESLCRRKFYPYRDTRYLDWPSREQGTYRLWLGEDFELVSLSSLTSGGTAISGYLLDPHASGPPYTRLEIDQATGEALEVADGIGQRSIALTGVFGACADLTDAGVLAEALDASETGVDITGAVLSPGHVLKVDSEYMICTGRSLLTTGATVSGSVAASKGADGITVSSAAGFTAGEVITVDSERMLIVDIAGSVLIVQRAWSGSTLAAHSNGATVYAPRTLTVTRGALGTTATSHDNGTAISVHTPPSLVRQLNIAEAIFSLQNEQAGYARSVGVQGENYRQVKVGTIEMLRQQVYDAHGASVRESAI